MPLIPLDRLVGKHESLMEIARRLNGLERGLVITSGQMGTGKSTTLVALAQFIAADNRQVRIVTDQTDHELFVELLKPLPENWSVTVESGREQTDAMFASIPGDDTIVVSTQLNDVNARAAVALARSKLVLGTIDTPLIGQDIAYALRGMRVSYEEFSDVAVCIWSQTLVSKLCSQCSEEFELPDEDLRHFFPLGNPVTKLRREVGCEKCDWTGSAGRDVLCDVTFIDDTSRRHFRASLLSGSTQDSDPRNHVQMASEARRLLEIGTLGVGTYRDMILRNPLLRSANLIDREKAHSTKLGKLFDKFVAPSVKQRLMDEKLTDTIITGEYRVVTCLFCDLCDFTPRAEKREPQQLFHELNLYFTDIVDAVLTHEGTIDKFIGDAVLAIFGAPMDQTDHAQRAVDCSLAIRQRIVELNRTHSLDLPMEIRIGINTGKAVAGCLGTDERMQYTVLGDAVNTAARLESRAEPGQILISDSTRRNIAGGYRLKSIGALELKGKAQAIDTFAVLGKL